MAAPHTSITASLLSMVCFCDPSSFWLPESLHLFKIERAIPPYESKLVPWTGFETGLHKPELLV